jgi:hypothetical protein
VAVIKQETLIYAMSLGRVVYLTRLEYKRMIFSKGLYSENILYFFTAETASVV